MQPAGGTSWHGMGDGEINIVFYAEDGRIAGRSHVWVQEALNVTVAMFQRMGLEMNLGKTKAVDSTPGFV